MNNIWLAFITGLTTGGISCFAVQGGLLASSISHQETKYHKTSVIFFLIAKLAAYTILGALLGYLGSKVLLSPKTQGYMQIFAGFVMIIAVGKLLDIHPVFKKFSITAPKSIYRLARKQSDKEGIFIPGVLGALTVFIPCGVTQAMMLLAISSGNAFWGGIILFSFILGTTPVFFILGLASNKIFENPKLKYLGALAIFVLAIVSINTGQVLRGSSHTFQNYYLAASGKLDLDNETTKGKIAGVNTSGSQEAEIQVVTGGYRSDTQSLQSGIPVTLKLITNNTRGCSRAFTIPTYNISKILPETGVETVEFTPTQKGRLVYTCSMGMYTGYFEVI
jgi:sulfite exporter TauE/SafE